jgi:HAD superfamily hydrolase (TIGR01509 family)
MNILLQNYDFIVFDFDGLLVNTEHLHFQAYQKMCFDRGFTLSWDFARYCSIAHVSSEGIQKQIYEDFPLLKQQEPNFSVLYAEKKKAYEEMLAQGKISLMPGVERCLDTIRRQKIRSCIVTNSFRKQVEKICEQIPLLQAIPFQITREDYVNPKPCPDAYLAALQRYANPQDKVLGFEDTIRGYRALQSAGIEGVLIANKCPEGFTGPYASSFSEVISG